MFRSLALLVALTTCALAGDPDQGAASQAAKPANPSGASGGDMTFMLVMVGGMFLFMYLFIIRPQRKEEKRKKEMLSATKKGDNIELISGQRGTVVSIGEQTVEVRICESPAVDTVFNRNAISRNLSQEPVNTPAKGK